MHERIVCFLTGSLSIVLQSDPAKKLLPRSGLQQDKVSWCPFDEQNRCCCSAAHNASGFILMSWNLMHLLFQCRCGSEAEPFDWILLRRSCSVWFSYVFIILWLCWLWMGLDGLDGLDTGSVSVLRSKSPGVFWVQELQLFSRPRASWSAALQHNIWDFKRCKCL